MKEPQKPVMPKNMAGSARTYLYITQLETYAAWQKLEIVKLRKLLGKEEKQ